MSAVFSGTRKDTMKATQRLHDLGQSLWLDTVSREILDDGTLRRYIEEFSVTGLTSNPTIFDEAIGSGDMYDESIRTLAAEGKTGEALFVELALEDLRRAADLFRSIFDSTDQIDDWASMELSPLLAGDTVGSVESAERIYRQADRPNLFVKIPGTPAGVGTIEESIFAGVPINVTLLFSREQYLASAKAYLRGIERRIAAGLDPRVASVASAFISRWDKAVAEKAPPTLHNRLGIAVAGVTYVAYRRLLASDRWRVLERAGAKPQRLLWGSTAPKTRMHQTRCTSKRWLLRTRSTPSRKKHCAPSPITENFAARWPATARIPNKCWQRSKSKGLKSPHLQPSCSAKKPRLSSSRGSRCLAESPKRAKHCLMPECAVRKSQ